MAGFPVEAVEVKTEVVFRIPWEGRDIGQDQAGVLDTYRAALAGQGLLRPGDGEHFSFSTLKSPWIPLLWQASGTVQGGHRAVPTRWYTEVRGEWWTVRTGPEIALTEQGAVYSSLVACPPTAESAFDAMLQSPPTDIGAATAAAFANCMRLTDALPRRLAEAPQPQRAWAEVAATLSLITQDARSVRVLAIIDDAQSDTHWFRTPEYTGPKVHGTRLEALFEIDFPDERREVSQVWFATDLKQDTWQLDSGTTVGRIQFDHE